MNTISSQLECISDLCKHCDLYTHQKAALHWSICKKVLCVIHFWVFLHSHHKMSLLEFQHNMRFSWNRHLIIKLSTGIYDHLLHPVF